MCKLIVIAWHESLIPEFEHGVSNISVFRISINESLCGTGNPVMSLRIPLKIDLSTGRFIAQLNYYLC
jgi:hypothetical protein